MRSRPRITLETPAWYFQVWAAFVLSLLMTAVGIYLAPVDPWIRGYLAMGMFFTVSSCFALSKTVRDRHEGDKIHRKLDEAEAERILFESAQSANGRHATP